MTFNKNTYPTKNKDNPDQSTDVLILSEDELMYVGYYDFKYKEWKLYQEGWLEIDLGNFIWTYKPGELTHAEAKQLVLEL